MRNDIALTVAVALFLTTPAGAAENGPRFAERGTTLLQGEVNVGFSEEEEEVSGPGIPDSEKAKTTSFDLTAGPAFLHFVADGFAIGIGPVLAYSSVDDEDVETTFTAYGMVFGPHYYAELNPAMFASIGGGLGAMMGEGERKEPGSTVDIKSTVFLMGADVGLAFPFGSGGLLEFQASISKFSTAVEFDSPEGDREVDTTKTSFGISTALGVWF